LSQRVLNRLAQNSFVGLVVVRRTSPTATHGILNGARNLTVSLLISGATIGASARAGNLQISFAPVPGACPIVGVDRRLATIYVDPADLQPAGIASQLLSDDIARVTGHAPAIVTDAAQLGSSAVLVGTLGHSRGIDSLIAAGKLDVTGLAQSPEAYRLQVIANPLAGVDSALVIVGSDRRGTAYGVTTLSSRMGVSPWYWWANVPTPHRDALYVLANSYTDGSPAVRYRGIFINDEAPAMTGWAKKRFGGLNSKMYVHVFELLLRLRANYLWPAMWGNAFNEDDPQNPRLANDYGIVMGTSHQEPMMRAQAEWDRRHHGADWNFAADPAGLEQFWRDGIKRNKNYENLITIGMRGRDDTPMIKGATVQQSMDLLERIVQVQRKIISEEVNPDPTKVPQMWCLYKEVQSYYEHGMRVPDDVTLLWSDDNWGDLRRLPTEAERNRPGGAGIYYHFDYVGDPRNYKWINTNPIAKVWEQMSLAHAYGADRVWIVNVGDLKPMEFPINFFLDLAWDPAAMTRQRISEYGRQWAAAQFGDPNATEIADLIAWYTRMNGRRKPELLTDMPYSLNGYHEADDVLADCRARSAQALALAQQIPKEARDAYFQLVEHPVEATSIVNQLYILAAMNHLYAAQGRTSTNAIADEVEQLFKADAELSNKYNRGVAGGSWDHMMDQTHIGYTHWQEPKTNNLPMLRRLQPVQPPLMGAANENNTDSPLAFDALNRQIHTIDVFNRGLTPFTYNAVTDQPWVIIDRPAGIVDQDRRLQVSIDWTRLSPGLASATITIHGAGADTAKFALTAFTPAMATRENLDGFAEDSGVVSMQAAHYSKKTDAPGVSWEQVSDLGLTGSAMTIFPATAASGMPDGSGSPAPSLEYRVFLDSPRPATVTAIISPTQACVPGRGLRYAIAFDDQPLQTIDTLAGETHVSWEKSVSDGVRRSQSSHILTTPGYHTLKIYMVDPALVLQKVVIDLGGERPAYLGPPESFHRNTH
jgi:hypothetical protein